MNIRIVSFSHKPISIAFRKQKYACMTLPFYIAQGGQDSNLQSVDRRFESHRRRGVFWYGPLASPLLQISSLASEHRGEKNAGPNQ